MNKLFLLNKNNEFFKKNKLNNYKLIAYKSKKIIKFVILNNI
jgi:hypothetical protein